MAWNWESLRLHKSRSSPVCIPDDLLVPCGVPPTVALQPLELPEAPASCWLQGGPADLGFVLGLLGKLLCSFSLCSGQLFSSLGNTVLPFPVLGVIFGMMPEARWRFFHQLSACRKYSYGPWSTACTAHRIVRYYIGSTSFMRRNVTRLSSIPGSSS